MTKLFEIKDGQIITASGNIFDCVQFKTDCGNPVTAYNNWFRRDIVPIWQANGVTSRTFNSYLEIGVNCGVSMMWVIENLLTHDAFVIGVDPYAAKKGRVHDGLQVARQLCSQNLKPYRYTGLTELKVIPESSRSYLPRAVEIADGQTPFELVYIDGSHYAPDALLDMMMSFELMAEGGVMIVDDYNRQFSHGAKQVRPAADAFFNCYSNVLEPLFMTQKQIAFTKRTSRRSRR